jgi:hypothetical protein
MARVGIGVFLSVENYTFIGPVPLWEGPEFERKQSKKKYLVRFEVLTAFVMKSSVLWAIMPCSPLKVI